MKKEENKKPVKEVEYEYDENAEIHVELEESSNDKINYEYDEDAEIFISKGSKKRK